MNSHLDHSKGISKREFIFDIFSNNLNAVKLHPNVRVQPNLEESYICPLCLKIFEKRALIDKYADHLTLEDIPPKALGGKASILTCKICNNKSGSSLDSHLVKKVISDVIFSGTSDLEINASFQPNGKISIPATVRILPGNTVDIQYHGDRTNPKNIIELHKMEKDNKISKIRLVLYPGFKKNRPEIALIRIAYLLAFAQFGYGFLLNGNLSIIRNQIQNPTLKVLPDWGIIYSKLPDSFLGVNILNKPEELKSFIVAFDLSINEKTIRYGVLLPGPTEPGANIYNYLAEQKRLNSRVEIEHKIILIPQENYLKDPKNVFASFDFWNES